MRMISSRPYTRTEIEGATVLFNKAYKAFKSKQGEPFENESFYLSDGLLNSTSESNGYPLTLNHDEELVSYIALDDDHSLYCVCYDNDGRILSTYKIENNKFILLEE